MEITRKNIGQAIQALRKCAEEHKTEVVPTFGIVTYALCNDVADYLEKIQKLSLIEMPSEEDASFESAHLLGLSGHDDGERREEAYLDGFADCLHWLKSKVK